MTDISIKDTIDYWNWLAYYSEEVWANKVEYYCTPRQPWLALTENWWKVMRMLTDLASWDLAQGKSITWAGWSPDYSFVATDLATVKALTFS